MFVLCVIAGVLAIFGVLALIAWFIEWLGTRRPNRVKMSYYDFKVRYGLDPSYWILEDGYAEFCYNHEVYSVRFGFLDYIRYEIFTVKRDHKLDEKRQLKCSEELTEAFRQFDREKEYNPDA